MIYIISRVGLKNTTLLIKHLDTFFYLPSHPLPLLTPSAFLPALIQQAGSLRCLVFPFACLVRRHGDDHIWWGCWLPALGRRRVANERPDASESAPLPFAQAPAHNVSSCHSKGYTFALLSFWNSGLVNLYAHARLEG